MVNLLTAAYTGFVPPAVNGLAPAIPVGPVQPDPFAPIVAQAVAPVEPHQGNAVIPAPTARPTKRVRFAEHTEGLFTLISGTLYSFSTHLFLNISQMYEVSLGHRWE